MCGWLFFKKASMCHASVLLTCTLSRRMLFNCTPPQLLQWDQPMSYLPVLCICFSCQQICNPLHLCEIQLSPLHSKANFQFEALYDSSWQETLVGKSVHLIVNVQLSGAKLNLRPGVLFCHICHTMNAWRVNSPASASRTPGQLVSASNSDLTTAGPPCPCISMTSSPVTSIRAIQRQGNKSINMSLPQMTNPDFELIHIWYNNFPKKLIPETNFRMLWQGSEDWLAQNISLKLRIMKMHPKKQLPTL